MTYFFLDLKPGGLPWEDCIVFRDDVSTDLSAWPGASADSCCTRSGFRTGDIAAGAHSNLGLISEHFTTKFASFTIEDTVKPVYNDHPRQPKFVAVIDR